MHCYRVPITVVLVQTSHLAVTFQMLITRLAYMLELTSVGPMGRLCLARFSSSPSLSCPAFGSGFKYCSYLASSVINNYWFYHAVGVSSWS